jgi:hypothetical protein
MQSKATSVVQYLAELPDDRRHAIAAVRKVILANLDKPFAEGMQYGGIGYFVPHSVYPAGYHCDPKQPLPYVGLCSQKNHMALYAFCLYADADDAEQFQREWKATGKKLDMGKSCIRFKELDDVPLEVIGRMIKRVTAKKFIAHYEAAIQRTRPAARPAKKKATSRKRGG